MSRSAHDLAVPIRAGVHTGEVEFVGRDIRGVAVHADTEGGSRIRAARPRALAGRSDADAGHGLQQTRAQQRN